MQPYWQAGGCIVIAVLGLTVALGVKLDKGRIWWVSAWGFAALMFALAAGFYAKGTVVDGAVGFVVGWNPWVRLALGLGLLFGVASVVAAAVPQKWHEEAASIGLVAFLVILPAALDHRVIPGTTNTFLDGAATGLAAPALKLTAGWFA